MTTLSDTETLGAAKQWLLERIDNGAACPCCTRFVKQYRRVLNAGMASALIRLYAANGTEFQDKTETLRGVGPAARDESLLRHWGLLEESREVRSDGGRAGWWRVTAKGQAFVLGDITVRSHVRIFANHFMGLEGANVDIDTCLGRSFDLADLMALRAAAS